MDSAKIVSSGDIISGFDLWLFNEDKVKSLDFICRGCGIELLAAAYQKQRKSSKKGKSNKRKVRPYFRRRKLDSHKNYCDVEAIDKLKARAKYEPVEKPNGFPVSYPSKLKLLNIQEIVRSIENFKCRKNAEQRVSSVSDKNDTEAANRKKHNWTARTIRPLCRFYLSFPYDRNQQLNAPPAIGSTYKNIFRKLKYTAELKLSEPKIYYGSLNFKSTLKNKEYADVTLNEGEWIRDINEAENQVNSPKNLFVVRIHTKEWDAKEKYVLNSIDIARNEAKKRTNKKNEKRNKKTVENKPKNRVWLFFIGQQDENNKFLFHVRDHRLICCELGVLIYPKS